MASCRVPRIAGQACSRTIFGLNIHTSFPAWPWLPSPFSCSPPPPCSLKRLVSGFSPHSRGTRLTFATKTVKRNPAPIPQSGTAGAQQSQGESGIQDTSPKDVEQPVRLRSLLTRPVLTSIANYAVIALLDVAAMVLLPLVWSTPINLGGLGLSPAYIGLWTCGYGVSSALFQYAVFPPAIARFGPRPVFITGIALFSVAFVLFPLENLVARHATGGGTVRAVWPLIVLQLLSISISDMSFGMSPVLVAM